jgi:hypothetical protein
VSFCAVAKPASERAANGAMYSDNILAVVEILEISELISDAGA